MAILARETKKVRLLCLGMPIGNRMDAVRVAEEYAMIDVISRGRLEMGFVKGAPFEIWPANSNPATLMERFWEAHDLILKALTTHDGPFNWEGEYFQYRHVNVWPRPYQAPHPPIWMTVMSPGSAAEAGARCYSIASLNTGYCRTPDIFDGYRSAASKAGREAPKERFGYLAIVGVGDTAEEGKRRADQILDYSRTTPRAASQFWFPPGYTSNEITAEMLHDRGPNMIQLRNGGEFRMQYGTVDEFIDAGVAFAGTPDMVFDQIKEFHDHVGGLGQLLMMGQGGHISHEDTVANLKLFSKEVLPRLEEL